ncbi:MAG: hypothetical protein ACSHX2_07040 [Rubritalea sp.]
MQSLTFDLQRLDTPAHNKVLRTQPPAFVQVKNARTSHYPKKQKGPSIMTLSQS